MKSARLLLIAAGLSAAAAASADDRLFLAGGDVADGSYYGYTGLILPAFGRHDGRGFFQRYWLDRFGYEYDAAAGRIEANAWGAEAALGWGSGSEQGWGSVSLGARYTNTDLSPDDPKATARGDQVGVKLQVEGERHLTDTWHLGGTASYTSAQNGYWGRVRLMHGPAQGHAFGVEFIAAGNDEYNSTAEGLIARFQPKASKWSVLLHGGYRQQTSFEGAYGGLEFGYAF
jgi:hypothetical protein